MATILRLRRTDAAESEYLLLHVTPTGTNNLDLKLIGTNQEHLYHGSIRDSSINSLQASNFAGDLEEWRSVLLYALLHQRDQGPLPESLVGVEAVAAISGSILTVTVRKNIDGITQRLGTIKLDEDTDREQVGPFDWVEEAVATSDQLRLERDTLRESLVAQRQEASKLQAELDRLITAKKEHEDELLSKFAALLNSKKLKIRDQQRLLSGAKIDSAAADEVSNARSSNGRSRKPTQSRGNKRKAKAGLDPVDEGDKSDEGPSEDESVGVNGNDDRRRQETPETDDEDIDEDELDTTRRVTIRSSMQPSQDRMEVDEPQSIPAASSRGGKAIAAQSLTPPPTATATAPHEDDDETDDEL